MGRDHRPDVYPAYRGGIILIGATRTWILSYIKRIPGFTCSSATIHNVFAQLGVLDMLRSSEN